MPHICAHGDPVRARQANKGVWVRHCCTATLLTGSCSCHDVCGGGRGKTGQCPAVAGVWTTLCTVGGLQAHAHGALEGLASLPWRAEARLAQLANGGGTVTDLLCAQRCVVQLASSYMPAAAMPVAARRARVYMPPRIMAVCRGASGWWGCFGYLQKPCVPPTPRTTHRARGPGASGKGSMQCVWTHAHVLPFQHAPTPGERMSSAGFVLLMYECMCDTGKSSASKGNAGCSHDSAWHASAQPTPGAAVQSQEARPCTHAPPPGTARHAVSGRAS